MIRALLWWVWTATRLLLELAVLAVLLFVLWVAWTGG